MKETAKKLWGFIKYDKVYLFLSVVCAVLSVLSTLFAPLVIANIIDDMIGKDSVNFSAIGKMLLLLAAIYIGGVLFSWLLAFYTNKISYYTVNRIRKALFNKLQFLPLNFYDRIPHGDTISKFINDVDTISDGMLQGLMALLQGTATIIGSVIFMLHLNTLMAVVVILSAPASFYAARFITVRSQKLFAKQAKYLGELNGLAEEMIEGQKIVKAFSYEERAMERFDKINNELYTAGFMSQFMSALANPTTRIVNNTAYAVIGIIGGISALNGIITVGDISGFLIFAGIFSKPFNEITGVMTQIQTAAASAQRVFGIIDTEEEPTDKNSSKLIKDCEGRVEFKNVSFSYSPEKTLITNLDMEVQPGSKVAIVGGTGAGKTTLVNLLMRFYDVTGGAVLVDGVDIRDIPRSNLRAQFAMVLQETWLINGTIRDNIAYAKPDASMEEIIAAAKNSGAHSFIRKLEKGYDTLITSDGDSLSQGQKQLLTIARVMLADAPILILDEATSNIDTYAELRIQKAFARLTQGRTSFVIAHRLSTVKNSDVILVMEKGDVVERGTHQSLLEQNGYYARLYNSQFAGQEA